MSSSTALNSKRLIVEYIDSLINQIDIHTEEQLKSYSGKNMLVEEPNSSKKISVEDYLNATREEIIKMLNEAQAEAFKQLEIVKEDINREDLGNDKEKRVETVLGKVFSKRFPILIKIERFNEIRCKVKENQRLFKFYLIDVDFYINNQMMVLFT